MVVDDAPHGRVLPQEIGEVRAAYTPSSPTYKFHHLFLNVVEAPGSRVKPPNVDEMRWRQVLAQAGGPNNPENLWPVQVKIVVCECEMCVCESVGACSLWIPAPRTLVLE